jgi:hypothetical protein
MDPRAIVRSMHENVMPAVEAGRYLEAEEVLDRLLSQLTQKAPLPSPPEKDRNPVTTLAPGASRNRGWSSKGSSDGFGRAGIQGRS